MVTLIALLQLVKAFLIAWVASHTLADMPIAWGSRTLWHTVFVLTNGRVGPLFLYMAPALALYAFLSGCGLLFLQKWARRALVATFSLNAVYWILALAITSWNVDLGLRLSQPGFDQQSVAILVFVDVTVAICLTWGRNVPEAFAQYS